MNFCINFAYVFSLPSCSINKLFDNHKSNMLMRCEGVGQCGEPWALSTRLGLYGIRFFSWSLINGSFDVRGSLPHTSLYTHVSNNSATLIISPSVLPRKCLNVISYTLCPTGLYPERDHCPTHLVFPPWDACPYHCFKVLPLSTLTNNRWLYSKFFGFLHHKYEIECFRKVR